MNNFYKKVLIVAALLLGTLIGVFLARDRLPPASNQNVTPHDANSFAAQLLSMSFPDAQGVMQPLRQWQGKWLVVNFWATWCTPCRKEMPEFSLLQKKYAAKNIKFVGIALDSADKVADYSRQSPVAYPLLIANEAPMSIIRGLGNAPGGLPFTVIIDRDGKLYRSWLGIWKSDLLEPVLADLPQTASD